MRVIIFGATGMIGGGVLLECLRDARVTAVTTVGRRPVGLSHPKLEDVVVPDLFSSGANWECVVSRLGRYHACFYCLGRSAVGLDEEAYARVTYDLTVAVANGLVRQGAPMTFVYVSGVVTDASERGPSMWARVKGRTENALLRLPFRAAYMFRPGAVVPVDGVRSSTWWYRVVYLLSAPLLPVLQRLFPNAIVTSAEVGRAMIASVIAGLPSGIFETRHIAAVARRGTL